MYFSLLAASFTLYAQTPVYIDGGQCRNIKVDLVRVACYDSLTDDAMRQQGAPAVSRSSTQQPAQQDNIRDQLREKNLKMREELARLRQEGAGAGGDAEDADNFGRSRQRVVTDADGDRVMYDRVKELQKAPDGWLITLDSGQVWRQMYNKQYNLREGQDVKIAPSIWGKAYRLSVKELGGFIQVERIR